MSIIADFERELRRRVALRDSNATVHIGKSPAYMITGEYICVIETLYKRDIYAFNPDNKSWIVVYEN